MIKTPDQDCAIVAKSQKHACYPAYLNLQLLHPPGVCSYVLYSSSLYQVQTGRICCPVGHHDASLPRFVDVLYRLYHLSIHGFIPDPHIPLFSPLIADPYPHGQDLKLTILPTTTSAPMYQHHRFLIISASSPIVIQSPHSSPSASVTSLYSSTFVIPLTVKIASFPRHSLSTYRQVHHHPIITPSSRLIRLASQSPETSSSRDQCWRAWCQDA